MKSYLSLIPISAKVHRRQNRMIQLCIVFAVFLVTAVFSMAEMGARMEYTRLVGKHGNLSMSELFGSYMGQTLFLTAGILFLLILFAGILMISGSMNSTVAQRIEFFGMLRCIGMSKQQIVCGILVGIITVLLAANAPAKRASKVSPVAAVSGNSGSEKKVRHAVNTRFGRIEMILGINHAVSKKKNLILMIASFALSIILFLSFSVFVDFTNFFQRYFRPSDRRRKLRTCYGTELNIVNSISMSVSARMKQYGAMRAVGMDERQVTRMIVAEAVTYATLGCIVGCIIGLPLSKQIYDSLIAGHFPYAIWEFPTGSLAIILLFVSLAVVVAIYAPAKRMRSMPVIKAINEL